MGKVKTNQTPLEVVKLESGRPWAVPLGEFVVHWLLPAHWHLVPVLTNSAEFLPTESVCWPIQQIQSV